MQLLKNSVPTLVAITAAIAIGGGGAAVAAAAGGNGPSAPFMSAPETVANEIAVRTNGRHSVTAQCPDGKIAIGGGAETVPQQNWTANPVHNGPTGLTQDADGDWSAPQWTVTVDAEKTASGSNATLKAYVICATP